jgi:hypothetical protein
MLADLTQIYIKKNKVVKSYKDKKQTSMYMSESNESNSIANRIKQRIREKARPGRVGGNEHKKKVLNRINEMEKRKKRRNYKIEC